MNLPRATGIMARASASRCWGLLRAVLTILLLAGPVGAQQTSVQAGGELAVKAMRQIEALLTAKAQRTSAQRKVSSRLLPARQAQEYGVARRETPVEVAADETVTVDIRADVTPGVLARIRALGGTVINSVPRYRAIRARLPLAAVEPLATLDAVQTIRAADEAVTHARAQGLRSNIRSDVAATRAVDTSEGDVAHQANQARQTHSVDGTGIGIGVLSNGVRTLAARQASDDLPDRVTVLPGQAGRGDEGTAMLEIVHDLAPGADLYFATALGGQGRFAANIEALCDVGADVIVDDVYYILEAAFQDDLIAQGVNAAVADGCVFITAGGNGGNLNDGTAGVWEGDYAAGGALAVNGVSVGVLHDFGGGVEKNRITEDSRLGYVLQWADPLWASTNDYDLFLIDADNNVLDSSTNTQDGTQDPIELIVSSEDDHTDARLLIVKTAGAADRYLRLDTLEGRLAIATEGNVFGHSAAENAVSVAAVDARAAAGDGGVFDGTESVRRSNSDGPRRIFFQPDGTPITAGNFSSTGGKLLQKPDLAAATCVSTSTPGFSPFCGVSSAAPHAVAIAALMLEAAGGPDNVTPAALRTAMTGSALDIEATGVDRDSGAGIVMAPGAVDAVDVAVADRNGAPTVSGTLADRTMALGSGAVTIDVAGAFTDPDNDILTYMVLSSDPDRLAVTLTGSRLMLTPGAPGLFVVAVRAADPDGLSATQAFSVTVPAGNRDYDLDDDRLIEVATLAQLDALRYDLNGDGAVDVPADWTPYGAAFPEGVLDMGCPAGCLGYELTRNLNFDTNDSGGDDAGDDYWNGGDGWLPIGGDGTTADATRLFLVNSFNAIFEGNGHTVSNLFIETDTGVLSGLFGIAVTSSIRNVGLIDVDVTGAYLAGGLIGFNSGEIRGSYVTGRVSGVENVGGLVGINSSAGEIHGSYATNRVSGKDDVGGLAGDNRGTINASYATGRVSGEKNVGGLVGLNQSTGKILAGYATGRVSGEKNVGGLVGFFEGGGITSSYWDTSTSGHTMGRSGEDKTAEELQVPTGYNGIYQSWNVDLDGDNVNDEPWDFGTASQYPVLAVDVDGNDRATWQEFGYQLREGPTLTATTGQTPVHLSWTAVEASHWTTAPSVTYTLYRNDGATVEIIAENIGNRAYVDTNVIVSTTYTYQVAAVVSGGEATRSGWLSVTVTVPISAIGLSASAGDGEVRLRWNRPAGNGGSPIIRYEYRYAVSGEEWSDWENVEARSSGVTVENLVNGQEYVFEARAVNALGKGPAETATAEPVSGAGTGTGGGGGFGGGGGGGSSTTVPGAPVNLTAVGGDGEVVLSWVVPENDGGAAITDYQYRINARNPWISIGSTQTTHTVTGLVNDTVYVFEVRAVNRIGKSFSSNRAEATPEAPEVFTLDFAHFANGAGITSEMVLVNVAPHPIRPAIYFYDRGGRLIDPESVVDVTGDLEVTEDGSLSVRTEMEPLGELTISTHGQGELVSGSVKVLSDGPIGGGVRYGVPEIGVAGVGASEPVRDVLFPARRQEGGIRTAAALHNLGAEPMEVRCRLMSAGVSLEEAEIPLEANGQTSWFIEDTFTATDTSDFLGSVRCTAPGRGRFTAIAVEMDAAQRIFSTLSVVPVDRTGGGGGETVLDFAHFVNGTWITDLVFLNLETQPSRPAPTPFHTDILPSRPAIYFYDTEGNPIAAASVVDITGDLEITEDGALTVRSEMKPLGVLTISTHGRGALVSGSVRVVSEGLIGGMLRFEHPDLGVAGVGASPPLSDALFPVRRQEGGITTGVALHNLESSAGLVHCDLMREGVLLDGASIPLEANGQTAWLIDQAFPGTDTSDFAGSVRCSAPGGDLFTAVALEMDPGTRIFTTLPVVPVPERTDRE